MSKPGPSSDTREVLIVEDERDLGELYKQWLRPDYEVTAVISGEEAVDLFDQYWDAVLLDRRMPDMTGDEVLSKLRDEGYQYPVAMVTAVEPDFDIIEMGFDDYVVKPVTQENLHDLVDRLLGLKDYDSGMQRYFSLASKKATLEENKTPQELEDNAQYQALIRRLNSVKERVDTERDQIIKGQEADGAFQDRLGGRSPR